MFSCHCLNIIIETQNTDLDAVSKDLFPESEYKDTFFKQDIQLIRKENLIVTNKACPTLIEQRIIGSWEIFHCINCNLITYAVHQTNANAGVLISTKLFKLSDINRLKSSEQRSEVFNIVVKMQGNQEDLENDYVLGFDKNPNAVLRAHMNEVMARETSACEERVRDYTDQQFAALEALREKALNEYRTLTRLIVVRRNTVANSDDVTSNAIMKLTSTQPIGVASVGDSRTSGLSQINAPQKLATMSTGNAAKFNPQMDISRNGGSSSTFGHIDGASFDSEGLFSLEDMDDMQPSNDSNAAHYDDSDNEDTFGDESTLATGGGSVVGISRPRLGSASALLAKSLPVDIPVFMTAAAGGNVTSLTDDMTDEDDEDVLGGVTIASTGAGAADIAASIRALARSVHGADAVFGDLPRSTRPSFAANI